MGCNTSSSKKRSQGFKRQDDDDDDVIVRDVSSSAALATVSWKDRKSGSWSHGNFVKNNHNSVLEDSYQADKNRLLGSGAFGSVFKATCKATGAIRAVKAVKKTQLHSTFLTHEIGIMREMDHPNIVKLYEIFEDKRLVQMVMELCVGGELFDAILSEGHFSEAQAAMVMKQVLRGICYLHEQYLCHRDIKPENYLLLNKAPIEQNLIKLTDFGMAKRCAPGEELDELAGTAEYVAPEVLDGCYDHQCDMWSIGVLMYVMLCGYPPFQGESNEDVFEAIRVGHYSCSGSDWRHISEDAKDLVKRHLTRDPSDRCTAKVALSHMWIEHQAPKAQNASINGPNFVNNLRGFRSVNKLKKAAIHVVAGQLGESDIEHLRDLFLAMDKDGDGQLTAAEIREGLQTANVNVPADLQKVMESIDVDGSGCIDYTEFLAAALDQRTYAQEDLCWAAFNMFDKDGDGSISAEELAKIINGGVGETMGAGNVDELMQEVDTNGDGQIDFSEFMDMMRRADKKRKTTIDLTAVSAKLRQEEDDLLKARTSDVLGWLSGISPSILLGFRQKDNSSRRSCLNLAALASICSSRRN